MTAVLSFAFKEKARDGCHKREASATPDEDPEAL
jgi:hypothetical protein